MRTGYLGHKLYVATVCLLALVACAFCAGVGAVADDDDAENEALIFSEGKLTKGLDMGVDTSGSRHKWVTIEDEVMTIAYPSDQTWGAVFMTVGPPTDVDRPTRDYSDYSKLVIEMRGDEGGEIVDIGVKDDTDPDTGTETKIPTRLTGEWKSYEFEIQKFKTADLARLYVVTEFVFEDDRSSTIEVRSVKYVK